MFNLKNRKVNISKALWSVLVWQKGVAHIRALRNEAYRIYREDSGTSPPPPPPPQIPISKPGCGDLSRCRLPPVINHSTLAYVGHYPGADCHQSSTIPPWPMCVTIQGQTATSHQPFHPGLCGSLSRGRLPPVINHSTLAYVCHYPGADCHQSSTIPPWPMCVTIQGQTATSHQPFHPGLCVSLSRGRLPPVLNHSTLAYVCHYPGADCHQSSIIPPWPMCATIQGLSRLRLTQQSLKRVGHEGKPCLKGEQRHPPCLGRVPLS